MNNLDDELSTICAEFHFSEARDRQTSLYEIAAKKQESVTRILTLILNHKKQSLPFLLRSSDHGA